MIDFERFTLENGLKVIVHHDKSTQLTALNLLYNVGARDEEENLTGFAHLFEHLMFGGTPVIPAFDVPVMMAGGENNAFTNNDITNYYLSLPSSNIETGIWLEADRMRELNFSEKNLLTQKSVVIEEFKQRYLNQPYGDLMFLIRDLAYKVHPYRWPTIGKDPKHIEDAKPDDVKEFFYSHYAPNNAILSFSGSTTAEEAFKLVKKWFDPLPARKLKDKSIPEEPEQTESRFLDVTRDVPANLLVKCWHMGGRAGKQFKEMDLITDILSGGESGRFENRLVRERRAFSEANIYVSGEMDPGLVLFQGRVTEGMKMEKAEEIFNNELDLFLTDGPTPTEMQKIINRFESTHLLGNINSGSIAMNLAMFELMGDAGNLNREPELYRQISSTDLISTAREVFTPDNCSTILYRSDKR